MPLRTLLFRTAVAFVGTTVGFTTGTAVVLLPPQEVLLSPELSDTSHGATTVPLLPSPVAPLAVLFVASTTSTVVLLEASTVEFPEELVPGGARIGCVA